MELRQLRYFLAVADSRSFVSAASNLYLSRQAVSKAISQLEAELGVELFVRDPSGAFLTPTGLLFYERIRGIVKDVDALTEQIRTSGSRYHQRIRLAFAVGTIRLVEQDLLNFRNSRQNLEVVYSECSEDECYRMLQEHQADISVSVQKSQNAQFVSEQICSSRIGLLILDKIVLEDVEFLDVTDLSWIPLAVHSDKRLQDFCSKYRLAPLYQGQDYHRLFSLALSGKCALILPKCLIPDIVGLKWIPLEQEEFWQLYCTYPQSAESNLLYSSALEELKQQVLFLNEV